LIFIGKEEGMVVMAINHSAEPRAAARTPAPALISQLPRGFSVRKIQSGPTCGNFLCNDRVTPGQWSATTSLPRVCSFLLGKAQATRLHYATE
jgi:hypothetical protein